MGLAVAIQMDPIASVNIDADSTFVLALEAQARGHALYHYLPRHLSLKDGRVTAKGQRLEVRRERGRHHTLGPLETIELAAVDVILMRQDPPFDMGYITATHILEHLKDTTLVVTEPVSVRNAPEKLFATHFSGLMPPTLVSSDRDEIVAFRREHGEIILKPLFGNGGAGVFHLRPEDDNLNALLEMFTTFYREPIMVQRYLPEVRQGDKRIILIDGVAAGGNLHVGGTAKKTELSKREREICAALGPVLREQGLVFVGIDVIGGYLTEINVTSPTGIQEINRFDGKRLEKQIWDAIEARLKARGARTAA